MAFDAGAIIAKLQLQKGQWDESVKSVQNDLKGVSESTDQHSKKMAMSWQDMAKKTAIAVTAVTGALIALVKKTADYGDELWKTSQKTGIAVETLSGFKLAADKSDLSLRSLATGLARMSRTVSEAQQGMKEYQEILQRAGLVAVDSTGKMRSMDDMLYDLADKFKGMPDGVEKTALAMDIFGKAGMEMIPLLNLGSEGLKKEREEAERLGLVMSGSAAQASEKFNDELTTLKKAMLGLVLTIGQELLPMFQEIVEGIVKIVAGFGKWLKQNPEIIQAIKNIVESIKWMVTGIKDAIDWVGKLGDKLNSTGAIWNKVIQQQIEAELRAAKDRTKQHDLRLVEDKAERDSANDTAGTIIKLTDAVVGANRAAADAIKKATLDEHEYKIWAINSKYNQQRELLEKEKADAASLALNERARQTEITAVHREETARRGKLYDDMVGTIMKLQDKQRDKERDGIHKNNTLYSKAFTAISNSWRLVTQQMIFRATGMWLNIGQTTEKGTATLKDKFKATAEKINQYVQVLQQGFGQFFQALNQLSNQRYDNELSRLQTQYEKEVETINNSLMSQEEKDAALLVLEEKFQADTKLVKQQQLESEKKAAIIQAVMNMAAAITSSFATFGWPFGAIAAALAAAACAIQIRAIKAQQVALAEGGFVDQPTHALIGEAGPEAVVPLPKLEDMLGIGRGKKGNQQGIVNNWHISAWDGRDVERVVNSRVIPALKKALQRESFTVPAMAVR
jgi:TP901 family phage tail tape measure protein